MKNKLIAAAALGALALTGACGGGSADRPSASAIAKSIKGGDSALGTTVPA